MFRVVTTGEGENQKEQLELQGVSADSGGRYYTKFKDGNVVKQYIDQEAGWKPVTDPTYADIQSKFSNTLDFTGAKQTKLLVPAKISGREKYAGSPYSVVDGVFLPRSGINGFYPEAGPLKGQFVPLDGNYQYYVGGGELLMAEGKIQDDGFLRYSLKNPETGDISTRVAGVDMNGDGVYNAQDYLFSQNGDLYAKAGVYEINPKTNQLVKTSGRAFVETGPRSGITFQQLPVRDRKKYRDVIVGANELIPRLMSLIDKVQPGLVGAGATIDSIIDAVIGPFPENVKLTSDNIAAFKAEYRLVQRDLKRTFALGDRYPVAEQQINAALAGDPDGFFKNRYGLAAELKELMRYTLNEMEFKTALLENRAPNIRLRVPSGRINDPMIFENKHTMAYLNDRKAAGSNPVGTKILMSRTTAEARNKELPEDQKIPIPKGADGVILTVEEDKNNPGNYIFEPAPLEQQEQWRAEQQKMQPINTRGALITDLTSNFLKMLTQKKPLQGEFV
jgi:hypothetical protein